MTLQKKGKEIPENYRNIKTTVTEEVWDIDTHELISKRIIDQYIGIKVGRT